MLEDTLKLRVGNIAKFHKNYEAKFLRDRIKKKDENEYRYATIRSPGKDKGEKL